MAGGEGRHQVQLAGQHGPGHDPGQLAGILPGVGGVGAAHPQHLETGGLGGQDGASPHSSDLYKDGKLHLMCVSGKIHLST